MINLRREEEQGEIRPELNNKEEINIFKKKAIPFLTVMTLTFMLAVTASASATGTASSVPGPKATVEENVVTVKPKGFVDNINEGATKLQAANDLTPTATIEELKPNQKLNVQNADDISLYGTSRPGDFWNLSSRSYSGSYWTNNSLLFTNYYFSPNTNGKLYLDITTTADPGVSYAYVYLYSKDGSSILLTNQLDVNKSYRITYSNLNVDKFYYMGFDCESKAKGHDGEFTVSQ